MPEAMKRKLMKEGRKKGLSGERLNNFVYGVITNYEKRKRKK